MIKFELFTHGVLDETDVLTEKAAVDLMGQAFRRIVPDEDSATKQWMDARVCLASGRGIEIENKEAGTLLKFTPHTVRNQREARSES